MPKNPEQQVSGRIKYSSSQGPVLELMGSLTREEGDDLGRWEIILGMTSNGKKMT